MEGASWRWLTSHSPRTVGGLYYDDADNLIFVLNAQRTLSPLVCTNIIFPCLSQSNGSQLVVIPYALVSGGNPLRISFSSFHHVKIIHTTRVPREGRRRKSLSSTSNGPHLVGIQTGGGGLKVIVSMTISWNLVQIQSSIRFLAWLGQWQGYLPGN
jgi:hypothetical protein